MPAAHRRRDRAADSAMVTAIVVRRKSVPDRSSRRGFGDLPRQSGLGRGGAHLVDHVFPVVPVRQWVLSLPYRLRYVLAWDHALQGTPSRRSGRSGRAVTGIFVRAVLASLRRRARQQGAFGGRGGAVAIIQRFGSALNLNIHVHALVLDGCMSRMARCCAFTRVIPRLTTRWIVCWRRSSA